MPVDDRAAWRRLPAGVWALGFVSLWMDVSSEMIHALLPVYFVTVLGASMATVGLIEGVAEATAAALKVVSGGLSDRLRRRKPLAVLGYGLSALTKPIFALAPSLGWVVLARILDRVGKGIRGAPRDALLAALTPSALRGAGFGLRQSLDTAGAVIGPLVAVVVMWVSGGNFRLVFWIAFIPALIAVWILATRVEERAPPPAAGCRPEEGQPGEGQAQLRWWAAAAAMGRRFWWVIAVAGLFALARFSEAFLILRAENVGLSVVFVPLLPVVMSLAFALTAYPAGTLSDRVGRVPVLAFGIALMIAADLVLAFLPSIAGAMLGVVLWGGHLGFTQGIFSALVADTVTEDMRGTGFGLMNLVTAGGVLVASVVLGVLWDLIGARGAFLVGAAMATLALLACPALARALGRAGRRPA